MALLQKSKHVAVKNDLIIFNCNYSIYSRVRLCYYMYSIDYWTQRGCFTSKLREIPLSDSLLNNKAKEIGKTTIYVVSYVFFYSFPCTFLFLFFFFLWSFPLSFLAFSDFVIHLFAVAFFSHTFILLPFPSSSRLFFSFTYVTITLFGFCFMLFLFSFHVPVHSLLFFFK